MLDGTENKRLEVRKNVNRGYRKLPTWKMGIDLYALLVTV